ncbi:trigger factor [Occallatibacter riparius]|uniref:Trigger factor n=1 Tax=Occallatibacter riparius TaxID=1002689 RepID=A0A9J7BMY5_9BACT|nr:trigger factor [Occallatibacter riparius]UWZ83865.1 trigger factor [Occallatibacter riparius]
MSSADTLENNQNPANVETGHEGHDHTHDHDHDHEHHHDHEHDHAGHNHGPVLNPECTRELVLDVPAEEVSKAYRNVTKNYQRYARIPGFRPGKVPEAVIKRKYAAEIRKDVVEGLLPERFNQGVRELGVTPVGQPQVTELNVEDGQPMHVKAVFEYVPDFSIEGYKDVTVPKPSAEVTEEEFRQEMEQLRESRATVEPVEEDRALTDGDWAQIAYTGKIEGDEEAAPINTDEALVEIGGKDTVAAFTSALRGAKVGQELHVSASYPAEYPQAQLAGKTVDYDITVKAIKKRTIPELNDDFAKELGGNYENLSELENRVREHLQNRKTRSVEGETKDKLFQAMIERFPFAVPESLVQEQIDARLDRGLRALAAQGMTPDAMRKLDFGRLREAQRDSAAAEVKASLLLAKIAQAENVEVSDEDVDREIQIAAIQSREPLETLRARLTQEGGLARIREQLKREKTAQLLYERLPA